MRFSDMSIEQLREEIGKFKEAALRAEQLGNVSEVATYERKIQVAKAYMINPEQFQPGKEYRLENDSEHTFKINYINGVFAWGHRLNPKKEAQEEEAIPISLLEEEIKQQE